MKVADGCECPLYLVYSIFIPIATIRSINVSVFNALRLVPLMNTKMSSHLVFLWYFSSVFLTVFSKVSTFLLGNEALLVFGITRHLSMLGCLKLVKACKWYLETFARKMC